MRCAYPDCRNPSADGDTLCVEHGFCAWHLPAEPLPLPRHVEWYWLGVAAAIVAYWGAGLIALVTMAARFGGVWLTLAVLPGAAVMVMTGVALAVGIAERRRRA